jgi:hypothetical protein
VCANLGHVVEVYPTREGAGQMIEERLIAVLRANSFLAIPLLLLFVKLFVIRISGDVDELFRRLVALPVELLFISMGITIAGLARNNPFASHYKSDTQADLAGAIILFALSVVAALVYRVTRRIHVLHQKFYAAMDSLKLQLAQPGFDFKNAPGRASWRIAWAMAYFLGAAALWFLCTALATLLLAQVFVRVK